MLSDMATPVADEWERGERRILAGFGGIWRFCHGYYGRGGKRQGGGGHGWEGRGEYPVVE